MSGSKRINTIVSFIDNGAKIADVGSDHCQVPIKALNEGKISYAQAIENKNGPYQRMVKEINNNGFKDSIEPSLSSGIDQLSDKVDTLIIAGMGGKLIKSIIQAHENKLCRIKAIIVDAHNDRPLLTEYLENIGYTLEKNSFFFEDGIAYDVMKWNKGKLECPYTQEELFFGPLNLKNKPVDWLKYWDGEYKRIESVLKNNSLPDNAKNHYDSLLNFIKINLFNN